ncbi:MAG TPA: hypothetical protein PKK69_07560, partial [Ferruginibacter sp.]|nr:hypothetical protein [Ferruginibacter sp.]
MLTTFTACNQSSSATKKETEDAKQETEKKSVLNNHDPIDTARYNQLQQYLANGDTTGKWPVKNVPYP